MFKLTFPYKTLLCMLFLAASLQLSAAEYTLGVGDVISVQVIGMEQYGGTTTVSTAGTIRLPVIGEIPVTGLTLAALETQLVQGYKKRVLDPEVFVTLVSQRNQQAYIAGMVKKPGIFSLQQAPGIFELLLAADGLLGEADMYRATLVRRTSGERVIVNLPKLLAGENNLALSPGDMFLIEALPTIKIYISGAVNSPGVYELSPGATLPQALLVARGVTGDIADFQAVIQRGDTRLLVPLQNIPANYSLYNNDLLRIESAIMKVTIAGEVKNPGSFDLAPEAGLASLLHLAGEVTPGANLTAVKITHKDGAQQLIDWAALSAKKEPVLLADGDIVSVPGSFLMVSIDGEVKLPGSYHLARGANVSQALLAAGGSTPLAALSAVQLLRANGDLLTIDMLHLGGETALHEGDKVIIPTNNQQIAIIGNVKNPGYLPLIEGSPMRIAEAVTRVGGVEPRSKTKSAYLLRRQGSEVTAIPVNLYDALRRGDDASNALMQAGDVLYVPKSKSINTSDMLQALYTITSVTRLFKVY